ncbi:MAG TPA: hypothetical protein VJI67_02055 [archaeon]|nr:hypothetical protein [archaeon]HLD81110.1 hypothetical protein [archaeon]
MGEKCAVCGKPVGAKGVSYDGKNFDSGKCVAKYKETHQGDSHTVCEFC